MRNLMVAAVVAFLGVALATARQNTNNDEGGRVLALEKVWNRALEEKDTKALDMLLANTMVSVDIDGSPIEERISRQHQSTRLSPVPGGHRAEHCTGLRRCGRRGGHLSRQGNRQRQTLLAPGTFCRYLD